MLPFPNPVLGIGVGPGWAQRAGEICFVRASVYTFWTLFFSFFSFLRQKVGPFTFLWIPIRVGVDFFGRFLFV